MEISNQEFLPATPQQVWDMLIDPTRLASCISGCESITPLDAPHSYDVVVATRIGPVSARFRGAIQLTELEAPTRYKVNFTGNAGPAGVAKGWATVRLKAAPGGTELHYVAEAQVGGKLAQVGSRLIDAAARKLADHFFSRFAAQWEAISREPLKETQEQHQATVSGWLKILRWRPRKISPRAIIQRLRIHLLTKRRPENRELE